MWTPDFNFSGLHQSLKKKKKKVSSSQSSTLKASLLETITFLNGTTRSADDEQDEQQLVRVLPPNLPRVQGFRSKTIRVQAHN